MLSRLSVNSWQPVFSYDLPDTNLMMIPWRLDLRVTVAQAKRIADDATGLLLHHHPPPLPHHHHPRILVLAPHPVVVTATGRNLDPDPGLGATLDTPKGSSKT